MSYVIGGRKFTIYVHSSYPYYPWISPVVALRGGRCTSGGQPGEVEETREFYGGAGNEITSNHLIR